MYMRETVSTLTLVVAKLKNEDQIQEWK